MTKLCTWTLRAPPTTLGARTTTVWRRIGHKPATTPGRRAVRTRRRDESETDYLSDARGLLAGWSREAREIKRTLCLDDAQHAALTERIKVVADALQLRPTIRRIEGAT